MTEREWCRVLAYVDAGTGSMIFYLVVALVVAAAVATLLAPLRRRSR